LNERHYGALQGLNKAEVERALGSEVVQRWRRDLDSVPPPMTEDHELFSEIYDNPR
jgi:2,3-bisphosphoglycerate-dependent phosphoglycerate mutase